MAANGCPIIGMTRSAIPKAVGFRKAAAATSTAASPTRLWNAATSCGIAVIAIRRAVTSPIAAPIPIATRISTAVVQSIPATKPVTAAFSTKSTVRGECVTSVVTTAIVIPTMPNRLPR